MDVYPYFMFLLLTQEGGNAVLMRTSPESEHFAPDILGHQIGGIKVSQYKPPIGIASQHRSPTCYLHEGPPGNYSSVRWTVG